MRTQAPPLHTFHNEPTSTQLTHRTAVIARRQRVAQNGMSTHYRCQGDTDTLALPAAHVTPAATTMNSAVSPSTNGSDEQRRSCIILVKERNDTNLDDPYETVSKTVYHTPVITSPLTPLSHSLLACCTLRPTVLVPLFRPSNRPATLSPSCPHWSLCLSISRHYSITSVDHTRTLLSLPPHHAVQQPPSPHSPHSAPPPHLTSSPPGKQNPSTLSVMARPPL